jgi:hypothetical protein
MSRYLRSGLPVLAALVGLLLGGCTSSAGEDPDDASGGSVEAPALGACRVLAPADISEPTNATETVDCAEPHTAETYAVGDFPADLHDASYDDRRLGAFAYDRCSAQLLKFLGADESMALRTLVSWAWFRPSEDAWADGARWYRCDVVGGHEASTSLLDLPKTAKGLMLPAPPDEYMACVAGEAVVGAPRTPCSERHDWRAVTTIKLGEPDDPYPGDRLVEVTSRDYCGKSVSAWLDYPLRYTFAYTWFHRAEWKAGNRLSVCWARTEG